MDGGGGGLGIISFVLTDGASGVKELGTLQKNKVKFGGTCVDTLSAHEAKALES